MYLWMIGVGAVVMPVSHFRRWRFPRFMGVVLLLDAVGVLLVERDRVAVVVFVVVGAGLLLWDWHRHRSDTYTVYGQPFTLDAAPDRPPNPGRVETWGFGGPYPAKRWRHPEHRVQGSTVYSGPHGGRVTVDWVERPAEATDVLLRWRSRRECRRRGGHWWHPLPGGLIDWFCCVCGVVTDGSPRDGDRR